VADGHDAALARQGVHEDHFCVLGIGEGRDVPPVEDVP